MEQTTENVVLLPQGAGSCPAPPALPLIEHLVEVIASLEQRIVKLETEMSGFLSALDQAASMLLKNSMARAMLPVDTREKLALYLKTRGIK